MRILTLVLCSFFLPPVSKAQLIDFLSVDGDSAVAYTNYNTLAIITDKGNTLKELNVPSDMNDYVHKVFIKGKVIIITKNYGSNYISTNQGADWKKFVLSEKSERVSSIVSNGSKLYIGTNDGLFLSETNGDAWEKVPGLKKFMMLSMAFDGNTIYAAGNEVEKYTPLFFISADGGKTWNKSLEGFPKSGNLSYMTLKGSVLETFLKTSDSNGGVYTYDIATKKWTHVTTEDKFYVHPTFTAMALSDTSYLVSSYDYLYYLSSDKGKTWKEIKTDFPKEEFKDGEELISGDGIIYNLTRKGHLFLSKDNGATWKKCKWQADADKMVADAAQAEKDKENVKYAKIKRYNDSAATAKTFRETNDKVIKDYFKGIAEMSYSNFDSALVKFNKAIAAKPDFSEAYQGRMKCYQALKHTDKAKNDSIALTGIMSKGKADALFAEHFKSNEKEVNNLSSEWHTDCYYKDAQGWYLRAKAHYSSEEQLKFLWKAIELDTTKAEYYIMLGDVSRDKYYDVAAEVHYKKAARLNPKCEWYDYDRLQMLTCGNCNGKGYRLQVNITQQKVNNTTHSSSESERKPCTECSGGYVQSTQKFPSVRLVK